jgi:hypothetical protein
LQRFWIALSLTLLAMTDFCNSLPSGFLVGFLFENVIVMMCLGVAAYENLRPGSGEFCTLLWKMRLIICEGGGISIF